MAENEPTNLGCSVAIEFLDGYTETLSNVTEIHYNYNSHNPILDDPGGPRIVFNSDIHGTGITYEISKIMTFETTLETETAESF